MTQPGWPSSGIGAVALTDLLGRWPAAEGPLYRLLATRIARLADTGELPAGLRLPAERDLAAALSVSRNTVSAAYQVLRDEGMAESRQGAGTRIVPHRTTPGGVHRANGFFAGLLSEAVVKADLSLAAVDCAPAVAAALTDPATLLDRAARDALTRTSGYFPYGLPELRTAIASHLTERLRLPASPARMIVTTGAQQALDLLIRSEVLPGQPVAVEDPTYPGVLDALHRAGATVIGMLADEILTPDSSRFWPADNCAPGTNPPSFDKQPLRDWLEDQPWDKQPPPPALPDEIVATTSARYVDSYERVCGRRLADWYGA